MPYREKGSGNGVCYGCDPPQRWARLNTHWNFNQHHRRLHDEYNFQGNNIQNNEMLMEENDVYYDAPDSPMNEYNMEPLKYYEGEIPSYLKTWHESPSNSDCRANESTCLGVVNPEERSPYFLNKQRIYFKECFEIISFNYC
jgi:hypothetical protein